MNLHRIVDRSLIDRAQVLSLIEGHVPESVYLNVSALDPLGRIYECEDDNEGQCAECVHWMMEESDDDACLSCKNFDIGNDADNWAWDIEQYL